MLPTCFLVVHSLLWVRGRILSRIGRCLQRQCTRNRQTAFWKVKRELEIGENERRLRGCPAQAQATGAPAQPAAGDRPACAAGWPHCVLFDLFFFFSSISSLFSSFCSIFFDCFLKAADTTALSRLAGRLGWLDADLRDHMFVGKRSPRSAK